MIRARMFSNGPVRFDLPFDATPWFEEARDAELRSLADGKWGRQCSAGDVAAFVAASTDDRLAMLFTALNRSHEVVRFGCEIDESDALNWLVINRPGLAWDYVDDEICAFANLRRIKPHVPEDEDRPEEVQLPLKRYLSDC